MAVVMFDPQNFKARFPEFSAVDNGLLAEYFGDAMLYLSNTDTSIVQNVDRRSRLLNLLTAHIAKLNGAGGSDGPGLVGNVASATEGTTSISYAVSPSSNDMEAWYKQTPYGWSYWNATLSFRTFRYFRRPTNPYGRNIF